MVVAVIPAAGSSSRMRFPKGALCIGGSTLLQLNCDALSQHVSSVVVVLGWSSSLVARGLSGRVRCVHAPDWLHGSQVDSVRLALSGLHRCSVIVQPADVPPPSAALLRALLASGGSAVPHFEGRPGHPVVLGPDAVERLRNEEPVEGLRTLLQGAREVPVHDPDVLRNLNHPRELARWLRCRSPRRDPSGEGRPPTR